MSHVERARVEETDLPAQTARAEVARLSLAVRTARREAELGEQQLERLDGLAADATTRLERSLAELVESRRHACDVDLDAERAAARRTVVAAREEAARRVAVMREGAAARSTTEPRPPDAPAPRLRLRVVGDDGVADAPHPSVPVDDDPAATVVVSPDDLHELVQAAVRAGLRDAIEQAVATMQVAPVLAGQVLSGQGLPAGQSPVPPAVDEPIVEERGLWRRFLYLDVALPALAALIVIVLFVAWVG